MAVNPPNPVSLPYNGRITMLATDRLILTFSVAGLFCSDDSDDFSPPLPNGQTFAAGDFWPDANNGAAPTGDKDSTYRYKTHPDAECGDDPDDTPPQVIHVGSGM